MNYTSLENLKLQNDLHSLGITEGQFKEIERIIKAAMESHVLKFKSLHGYNDLVIWTKFKVKYHGYNQNIIIPLYHLLNLQEKAVKQKKKNVNYNYVDLRRDNPGDKYHSLIKVGSYGQVFYVPPDISEKDLDVITKFKNNYPTIFNNYLATKDRILKDSQPIPAYLKRAFGKGEIPDRETHRNRDSVFNIRKTLDLIGLDKERDLLDKIVEEAQTKDLKFNRYLYKIVDVLEIPGFNRRIAIVAQAFASVKLNNKYVPVLWYISANSDQPIYNFLDKGRDLFYRNPPVSMLRYTYAGYVPQISEYPEIIFLEEGAKLPDDPKQLEKIGNELPGQSPTVTNADLEQKLASVLAQEMREKRQTDREKIRANALKERVSKVTDTIPIIINDIKFYSDRIEYEDQKFVTSVKTCKSMLRELLRLYGEQRLIFDNFLAYFLGIIRENTLALKTTTKLSTSTIGNVEVRFESKSKSSLYYVNDKRINKGELTDILRQALCFDKQDQFDAFVAAVSKCSLFLHDILANGITLDIYNEWGGSCLTIKLDIVRENNKNYIKIDKKTYQIKNVRTLKNKQKKIYHEWTSNGNISYNLSTGAFLELLANPNIANIKDVKIYKAIIKAGQDSFKNAIEKSKKLLESAEKTLKLKLETRQVQGRKRTGYLITGASGKKYFVDADDKSTGAHGAHYPVFHMPSGQAICIVDKSSSVNQPGKDALVNRLFALKNDKFVAREISTLRV